MACADSIFNISVFKKKCEQSDAFFRLELLKGLDYHYKHKPTFEPSINFSHEIEDEDGEDGESSSSDNDEDDENLLLIPEIELVTLNEDEQSEDDSGDSDDEEDEDGKPSVPFTENQVDGHVVSYECSTCKKTYLNRRFMEKHVRRNRCMQKRKNQT